MKMLSIPQRLVTALTVLFGKHGEITRQAAEQQRTRQALYREAQQLVSEVHRHPAEGQRDQLQRQLEQKERDLQTLTRRLEQSVEISPDRQAEFACLAQAEGVSLPVAQRLLQVFLGDKTPSVASLGRKTAAAAQRAGALLEVLDQALSPRVQQAAADEIFLAVNRL